MILLYIDALAKIMAWFFTLGHVHYDGYQSTCMIR